jgi:hypothetical protein
MSPKEAMDALRPEPEETDKLDDIKKILNVAINSFQTQNRQIIELLKVENTQIEQSKVINALQSQTETLIKALKSLEEKPEIKKKWKLETENIERGRDGRVTNMEVIAIQI